MAQSPSPLQTNQDTDSFGLISALLDRGEEDELCTAELASKQSPQVPWVHNVW